MRRYKKRRELMIAAGIWQFRVDAEPARQRVRQYMAFGFGRKTLAELLGMSEAGLGRLLYGHSGAPPSRTVLAETHAKIMAFKPDVRLLKPGRRVPAVGTHRRIQALAAVGYSLAWQARQLGWKPSNYWSILDRSQVTARTAWAVADLYDAHAMTPAELPDAEETRRQARQRGWVSAAAWDAIDDPDATPVLGERVRREVALAEDAVELFEQGYEHDLVAERLQVTRAWLHRALLRARQLGVVTFDGESWRLCANEEETEVVEGTLLEGEFG